MSTKDKILETALELFNEEGYNVTTTRHIAKKMNISPGNLHYHYKHSEEIVNEICNDLLQKTDLLIENVNNINSLNIEILQDYLKIVFALFYDYRFVFLNFVDILRAVPALHSSFYNIQKKREKQFISIIHSLQSLEIVQKDLPEKLIENVVSQIFLIGSTFIQYNLITERRTGSEAVEYYSKCATHLLIPLLTEKYKSVYMKSYF